MRRILATVAVMTCTLAGLSACGDDDGSEGSDAEPKVIKVRFADGKVTPNGERIEVETGQPVEFVVAADEPGEIHIHSEPEHELGLRRGRGGVPRRRVRQARRGRRRVPRSRAGHRPARSALGRLDYIVEAHGIGGQQDLPISLELAISGAVAALVVSFTVLAVAWRTPRFDAATSGRPAPGWLNRIVTSTGVPVAPAGFRVRGLPLHRGRGRLRQGHDHQPGVRHLLRAALGRRTPFVGAARSGVEGDQPGPLHQLAVREALGQRSRPGLLRVPRPARLLAGRHRPLRLRVARAGLRELHGPGLGAALVRGLRRADADRRCAVRQHLLRAGRPVRGVLQPGGQAVDLEHARRPADRAQPARQPGLRAGRSGTGWGHRDPVRQHGVRLVPGVDALGEVRPGVRHLGHRADQPRPARRSARPRSGCSRWAAC